MANAKGDWIMTSDSADGDDLVCDDCRHNLEECTCPPPSEEGDPRAEAHREEQEAAERADRRAFESECHTMADLLKMHHLPAGGDDATDWVLEFDRGDVAATARLWLDAGWTNAIQAGFAWKSELSPGRVAARLQKLGLTVQQVCAAGFRYNVGDLLQDEPPCAAAGKVPVTERALLQRVNRRLAAVDEMVKQSRPVREYVDAGYPNPYPHDLGKFYRVDTRHNFMIEAGVDLEVLAREVGALAECGGSRRDVTRGAVSRREARR